MRQVEKNNNNNNESNSLVHLIPVVGLGFYQGQQYLGPGGL